MDMPYYVELTEDDGSIVVDTFWSDNPVRALTSLADQATRREVFDYKWATCYSVAGDIKQWELSIA